MSAFNKTNEPGNRGGVVRKYPEDTPMEIEDEHASKRMRLAYQTGANLNVTCQAKVHLEPDWSVLPYTVLKHIYTVLPNKDRFSMSLACRSWNAPFRTPDLWRNLTFRFNRVQDKKAKRFCQTMVPTGVRHLNIDCKAIECGGHVKVSESVQYLLRFFRLLMTHNVNNLISLRLANIARMTNRYNLISKRKDLVMTLRGFVASQTQLRLLNMSCASIGLEQGTKMLLKAGRSCGNTIHKLIIDGLFDEDAVYMENLRMDDDDDDDDNDDDFGRSTAAIITKALLEPLKFYTKMSSLTTSYQYISKEILIMLAKYRKLNQLRVYVERGYEQTPITTETWQTVLGFIPDLEVSFHILFAIESDKFSEMLVPGVPLVGLDWLTRKDEDSRTWDHEEVSLIFEYIVEAFPNTLRFITLGLDDYPRKFVTLFDDILDKCLNIETLSVRAPDDRDKTFQMALAKFVTWAYERQPFSSFRELKFNDVVLVKMTGPHPSRYQ